MPDTMWMHSKGSSGLRAPGALSTLDPAVIGGLQRLERRLGKPVLPEMLEIFERHMPPSCLRLWQALDDDDAPALRQVSHKLKSSARCLGLQRLGELCARLETDARGGYLREVEDQLAAIEDEFERAASALRRFLSV